MNDEVGYADARRAAMCSYTTGEFGTPGRRALSCPRSRAFWQGYDRVKGLRLANEACYDEGDYIRYRDDEFIRRGRG